MLEDCKNPVQKKDRPQKMGITEYYIQFSVPSLYVSLPSVLKTFSINFTPYITSPKDVNEFDLVIITLIH